MLNEILERAKGDPAFSEIHRRFASSKVESWLMEDEKALHFAVGAFAPGDGVIVEIGSYKGGSACFLAAGLEKRGTGRLTCIDPHLGGPPWLGMSPAQHTLEEFRRGTRDCGVDGRIDTRVGDSVAVAAIWPGTPIDAVFIDGDHSFLGALRDYECWGPKVKPGGLVLVDDADDPCLPELLELIEFIKGLGSLRYLGTIQGIAVFQRTEMSSWELLSELSAACASRQIYRAWDLSVLHRKSLPPRYLKSKTWDEDDLDIGYQLCYLARCAAGFYAYSAASALGDRAVLKALSRDRGDGTVIEIGGISEKIGRLLGQPRTRFRAIVCRPDEARALAPRLMPGGVLLTRPWTKTEGAEKLEVRRTLIDAGLSGCGFGSEMHWGVWQPEELSADAVLNYALTDVA